MDSFTKRTVVILDNGLKMREEAGTSCSTSTLGFALQKTILTECNTAMLDYVRIFFSLKSEKHNLCVFRAGESPERITSWSSGDQSLQAVVDGLASSNQQTVPASADIKGSLEEAMRALLEPQPFSGSEQGSERETSAGTDRRVLERSTSRTSRASQGSQGSSQLNRALEGCGLQEDCLESRYGRPVESGGKLVEQHTVSTPAQVGASLCNAACTSSGTSSVGEAEPVSGQIILIQANQGSLPPNSISKLLTEARQAVDPDSSLASCEVVVLSVLPGEGTKQAPRLMGDPENSAEDEAALGDGSAFGKVEAAASTAGPMSIRKITLTAALVAPCLRSMAHLHLDLCTIVISPLNQEKEASANISIIVRRDNDLSPTLGERHRSPSGSGSSTDSDAEVKKTRLIQLTLASKSGGNASSLVPILPCAVSHAAVPERPLAMPTRNLVSHLVVGGLAVLSNPLLKLPVRRVAGSLKKPLPCATHMLTWQEGRLWLHQLQGAAWLGWGEEVAECTPREKRARANVVAPTPVPASLPRHDGETSRKRVRDVPSPSPSPSQLYHHLSVSVPDRSSPALPRTDSFKTPKSTEFARAFLPKPLVIPNPSSMTTEAQSILGSPLQQSAELAALLRPITRAFLGDDLDRDKACRAEKCIRKLWECTQANDHKLLPRLAESPKARQEVYRSLWKELWEMSRLFKNSSDAHRQLAQAIDFRQLPEQFRHCCPPPSPARSIDRRKSHSHINKRRRCEEVPRDQGGRPILPIKVGPSLTVLSLGRIVADRQTFHSDKYLWPVGFKSMRSYASMKQPDKRIQYCCEILDGGAAPEFRLTAEDDLNEPIVGVSATAVWTSVVKQVTMTRMDEGGKKTFANVSGPEYFGFANPTVARLLQELPGAARCEKYKMQQYEPNVPMRNRSPGESPASTTASSNSWRKADSFGGSPLDDDVSISGWGHLGSDLGDDGSDVGLDLSPHDFPGLTPDDIAAWMYPDAHAKPVKKTGASRSWTGLVTSAAAGGGARSPFLGSKTELPWSASGVGSGLPGTAPKPADPLEPLWLLPGEEDEGGDDLLPGDEMAWATLFSGFPSSG